MIISGVWIIVLFFIISGVFTVIKLIIKKGNFIKRVTKALVSLGSWDIDGARIGQVWS